MTTRIRIRSTTLIFNGTFSKHVRKAWRFFRSRGYSKKVTAAIIGNLMTESYPGLQTHAKNELGCKGIAQWCPESGRWRQLEAYAAKRGVSPYRFGLQLSFINHELEGSFDSARRAANRAGSVSGATVELEQHWEICGGPGPTECNEASRVRFANHVYYRFH